MTNDIFPVIEKIHDITGVKPVVAYERNNGGVFELERLSAMNRLSKYKIFEMRNSGRTENPEPTKIGYDTNTATRPKMLTDLKDAIDNKLLGVYDKITITELYSFVLVQTTSTIKAQAEKGAHDDLCFVAGTKVLTDKGQIPIEKIKIGDLVMTRKGYQPVMATGKRSAKVIYNKYLNLIGTSNHPVITMKGNIPLQSVKVNDNIYIWNEKLSTIEERTIIDTPSLIDDNCVSTSGDTISGKSHHFPYIGRSLLITLERYLRDMLFTTKTRIHLIMSPKIWRLYLDKSICGITCLLQRGGLFLLQTVIGKQADWLSNLQIGDKIILNWQGVSIKRMEEIKKIKQLKCLQIGDKIILRKQDLCNRRMEEGTRLSIGQSKRVVFNLKVANTPEYFANNILVHNCMSLAGAWQLYQLCSQPSQPVHSSDLPQFKARDSVIGI